MLRRVALLLMLTSLASCAGGLGQTYYVQFQTFSATPDAQGQATVQSVIAYAKQNPLMPVTIDGFHYGQYTNQVDTMAEERVRVVANMLVQGGISRSRIDILGKGGIAYAQGSPMAALPPNTVKVGVGL
ncbi:MAG: hypothetical protein U1E70_12145 [Acetobacteraceae bacterium]|nr:hypothetical protein [Pseudomonadota bacterium]